VVLYAVLDATDRAGWRASPVAICCRGRDRAARRRRPVLLSAAAELPLRHAEHTVYPPACCGLAARTKERPAAIVLTRSRAALSEAQTTVTLTE
jgi:hypothetical protein